MDRRLSLRTELLLNLALLAASALILGVASVLLLYGSLDETYAAIYISVIVAADVFVLVAFVAYQVERIVLRPLREAMQAAEAIAEGDLARRLQPGETREIHHLATSVNRMTDRLLEERSHLIRAEKMASIGRLAAGVAHEIGNPLGAINGYLHVLRGMPAGSAEARDTIAAVEREASRIDRIVRRLLEYARSRPRASMPVELGATIRSVVDLLATQGALKNIAVSLDLPSAPVFVPGDPHDLEQAFVNLLLNAVDAMEGKGSVSAVLRGVGRSELMAGARRASDAGSGPMNPPAARARKWLEGHAAETVVSVTVADTGPGIPESDVERIFEPFYTTKEPGKGTGLGLAIVARAIENSGGTIWVSPAREGGAAFRILLPASAGPSPARVSGAAPTDAGAVAKVAS